jgi:sphingolipid delta-4 desaturase
MAPPNRRLHASIRQTTLFLLSSPDYVYVTYGEPHAARGRQMLTAHPELRALAGPFPASAAWTLGLVLTQCGLAVIVGQRRWFVWLPCAYVIGATIDHALWALIHDCTHNLVFRSRTANRLVAILANLPLVVPGAISFAKYHLLHHRNMGDLELDAGIPGPTESRVIGRSGVGRRCGWRGPSRSRASCTQRLTRVSCWTADGRQYRGPVRMHGAVRLLAGGGLVLYLATSTVFAIGLHPLARGGFRSTLPGAGTGYLPYYDP